MKKLEAIIKPFKLADVKSALAGLGVHIMRVMDIQEAAPDSHVEVFRGTEYEVDFRARSFVIVVVEDDQCEAVLNAIRDAARTGNDGDGKVMITSIDRIVPVDEDVPVRA